MDDQGVSRDNKNNEILFGDILYQIELEEDRYVYINIE